MERTNALVVAIQNTIDSLNLNAKVVRVSENGCKIISECADKVAELINHNFCESVIAEAMSKDLTICRF